MARQFGVGRLVSDRFLENVLLVKIEDTGEQAASSIPLNAYWVTRDIMSTDTLALLGRPQPRPTRSWGRRMQRITDLLVTEYGTPSLGNFRDPIKEIFYIVLSAKTTETLYRKAHKRLWSRFATLEEIARASVSQIRACVASAGLGKK